MGYSGDRESDKKNARFFCGLQTGDFQPEMWFESDIPEGYIGMVYVPEGFQITPRMQNIAKRGGMNTDCLHQFKSALVQVDANRVGLLRAQIV